MSSRMYLRSACFLLLLLAAPSLVALDIVPAPPQIAARSHLLMDVHSGRILAEHQADQRVEPASLTKLMTAYAVFQELKSGGMKLEDEVRVSKKAWRMKGSLMFIEVGTTVSVKDLLMGMIVQSGNDASVALAEHTAGSEDAFAALMNQHAERLEMHDSHFVNSTGWPDKKHHTTARDLSKLTRALIAEFPDYYPWYSVKEYTYNNIRQSNRNRLLWLDDRVDGVKTGHTESAGYCLITSAKKNDMRLLSVVIGTKSEDGRIKASRALLNYGFRFFETHRLYEAGQSLTQMRIWKGEREQLDLGLAQPLYVTVQRGQRDKINAQMRVNATIMAPAFKGQNYGNVEVSVSDEMLNTRPLVALQDVPEGSIWRRLVDTVLLWFE
ncbi:MAG: D-alanyl-D-alanine carboxypeptidase [Pseudomonadota bacterium]|nr:MAG: D-alanyl-D-alanine carboxypeptidase [Pseudomonadota bacterium]